MAKESKLRRRRERKHVRKNELQARKDKLERKEAELTRKIKKAVANAKKRKTDATREKAADRADELAGQRKRVRAEIEEVKADLGQVNAVIRRLGRKIKKAAQKRLAKRRYWASENIRFDEFDCREGGPVPSYMYPHLRKLATQIIEPMRARFGAVYITSGHRWSWYDAKIGGVGGYHVYEKFRSQPAADLIFARGTPAQWAAYARSLPGIGGVGQYNGSGFVHVDHGPRRDWSG